MKIWGASDLTGGTSGCLDAIDGADLTGGDAAIVFKESIETTYMYHLDSSSSLSEDSPQVVAPDNNAGTKRWILSNLSMGSSVKWYVRSGLTGGTVTDLDGIPAGWTKDGDVAIVVVNSTQTVYFYTLEDSSGAAESSPDIIAPDDVGASNKRWLLASVYGAASVENSIIKWLF